MPPLSLLAAGCMGNWDKQLTCMREERWDLRNFALGVRVKGYPKP